MAVSSKNEHGGSTAFPPDEDAVLQEKIDKNRKTGAAGG